MSDEIPAAEAADDKPEKSAYEKLHPRFRRFVDHIVDGKTGADVARLLGFGGKEPRIWASRIKARPDVKAAIAERESEAMQEAGISLTRSWIEIRRIAYFDPAKLTGPLGECLALHDIDEDTRAAIAGVEVEELYEGEGRGRMRIGDVRKYRLASKLEANKLILQRFGELVDKHEHTGKDGQPLQAGGLLVVPGVVSEEAWVKASEAQQADLAAKERQASGSGGTTS